MMVRAERRAVHDLAAGARFADWVEVVQVEVARRLDDRAVGQTVGEAAAPGLVPRQFEQGRHHYPELMANSLAPGWTGEYYHRD